MILILDQWNTEKKSRSWESTQITQGGKNNISGVTLWIKIANSQWLVYKETGTKFNWTYHVPSKDYMG